MQFGSGKTQSEKCGKQRPHILLAARTRHKGARAHAVAPFSVLTGKRALLLWRALLPKTKRVRSDLVRFELLKDH